MKTADGYTLRLFVIGFTKRRPNQVKKTAYAQMNQIKMIRKKMIEVMQKEASSVDLMSLCTKFMTEVIGKEIEKACQSVFPLQNVYLRKVKSVKQAKTECMRVVVCFFNTAF